MSHPATETQITAWYEREPQAGVGIVLGSVSGLVVFDFDRGDWPDVETPTVRTARGVHLYTQTSEPVVGRALSWGELKAEGGMVVAPPSVHESGHVYEWLVPPETPLMSFENLARLVEMEPSASSNRNGSQRRDSAPLPSVTAVDYVVDLRLPPELEEYLANRPSKKERERLGIKGGGTEQRIICKMVNQGCSDGEIRAWFEHHQPPKFSERGMGWFLFSLRNARLNRSTEPSDVDSEEAITSPPTPPTLSRETGYIPDEEDEEDDLADQRPIGWWARRWVILRDLPEGLSVGEAEKYIHERFEIKRTQAQEDLKWLSDKGWLDKIPAPDDARRRILSRSDKGIERLASWRWPGIPLPFVLGIPKPKVTKVEQDERESREQPRAKVHAGRATSKPRSTRKTEPLDPEAEARKEFAAEERRRERNLINDHYRVHFGGRPTYVQMLTHPEDAIGVLLHEQLRIGRDAQGQTVRHSFISPTDPGPEGAGASDPIGERVLRDGGYPPAKRSFAWAAEMRTTRGGFEVATRIEDGEEIQNVGLIAQAWSNFYSPLMGVPDLMSHVIKVFRKASETQRDGRKDTSVRYWSRVAGDALALNYKLPSLDTFLTEMADPRHAEVTLASIDDDWLLVKKVPWRMS